MVIRRYKWFHSQIVFSNRICSLVAGFVPSSLLLLAIGEAESILVALLAADCDEHLSVALEVP